MNREIQEVESNLTDVGRRCNPGVIEKTYTHIRQIKNEAVGKGTRGKGFIMILYLTNSLDTEKRAFGAQISLLHRLTTTASKLLRRSASLLLIAKLLAVSRLLYKTLSQQAGVQTFLEGLRVELASLRRSLSRRTNKRLASMNVGVNDTIEALAAYCQDTSSSSDDAVRHFHQVRIEGIVNLLDDSDSCLSGEDVLKALKLYLEMLRTSKVLLSRRLSDVLGKLKSHPILDDSEIRGLDDLDIDVFGRWVAPDVKNFTPWIKLSEFTRPEAEMAIKEWSSSAFQAFINGSRKSLAGWTNFSELLSLRQKILEMCSRRRAQSLRIHRSVSWRTFGVFSMGCLLGFSMGWMGRWVNWRRTFPLRRGTGTTRSSTREHNSRSGTLL